VPVRVQTPTVPEEVIVSNFTQHVFTISLILSLLVGSLAGMLLLRGMKRPKWLVPYCVFAMLVHLLWLGWPVLSPRVMDVARWGFAIWLGTVLVAAALLPLLVLAVAFARIRGKQRSRHVPAAYAATCLICGVALCLGGASFRVREETVFVAGLDPRLDGFRVANFGDVHVDRFIAPADLGDAVRTIAGCDVDVLAVTGDLIDDFRLIEPTLDALDDPRIPAIVAIIGNHEKMGNLAPVLNAYRSRGDRFSLLIDSSTAVSRAGARVHFVGVDYAMGADGGHMLPAAEQKRIMARQAESAFPKTGLGEPVIALSHHPEFFPAAASQGAHLTLSSHTHGGQVKVFGRPLISAYDYMSGRYEADNKHLDVSAGFGHWLPLRLGVPREVVIVTLRTPKRSEQVAPEKPIRHVGRGFSGSTQAMRS
jgi:hypothetical protein